MADIITPPTPPAPKYTPRSAAADFTAGLPKLGVEETTVAATTETAKTAEVGAATATTKKTEAEKTAAPLIGEKGEGAKVEKPIVAPVEVKIPRTSKDWDAYKAAEKTRLAEKESEISKLTSEMAELRKAPPVSTVKDDDPRIVAATKTAEELSEKLRLVDITQHPKFKAYYDSKVNAQVEMAKRIVGSDNAEAVAALLKLPDNEYRAGKIDELVDQLSPIQQSRVGAVLNSLNEIEIERDGQIEQSKKDYAAFQETAKTKAAQQQAEAVKNAETAFASVVSTLQNPKDKEGLFIFQKQEGNEEWNKGVEERVKYAKDMLFGQNDPKALIRAALHAAALPGVVKSYQTALDKINALAEQVKGLSVAQPTLESHAVKEGGEKAPAAQKKDGSKGRFLGGREQSGDWVKSLNETQNAMAEAET